jgi:regulator of sigma E protease
MELLLIIGGLLLFVGLVVVHEIGHFLAARRNGVDVEEFGIGFPPRAKVLAEKKGTIYTLNWLPLGGFVRLKGENDSARSSGSFGVASLRAKIKIMMAGVVMNLVVAFLLLTLSALVGLPKLIPDQFTVASDTSQAKQEIYVGYVEPDSPADKAGLEVRDKIIALDYVTHECNDTLDPDADSSCSVPLNPIETAEELPKVTEENAGRTVPLRVERKGATRDLWVELRSREEVEASKKDGETKGYLGIAPTEYSLRRSTWSAPIVASGLIKQFTFETFKGLGAAIANVFRGEGTKASEQVSGPIGIFVLIKDGSVLGPEFILFVIAVISLTLAIMNALPIPALDGGRLFVTLLFRVMKKPLTKDLEDKIHGLGFAALMLLFLIITIVDIKRFF